MNADEKLGVRFIRVCPYPRSSVFIGGLILFFPRNWLTLIHFAGVA